MDEGQITRVLQMYGINGHVVGAPQKGYRNSSHRIKAIDGRELNLILYKSEHGILQRIKNANAVGASASRTLPVRTLADARILKVASNGRLSYAALYAYLPGKTIPWEAYTKEHIKQLGGMLAALHKSIKRYNVANLPDVTAENVAIQTRMLRYFNNANVVQAAAEKLHVRVPRSDFSALLRACSHLPEQQALHMDFVRGNILFDGKTITGIIDFEKTAAGSPLFDIARTMAFLLVDCKYKPEEKVRKYFLHSGYQKRGGAHIRDFTINGQSVLEQLIDFFLLHDFYKFLRHNPYESLNQNEHYIRTKALLLKRRLITEV
jgi:Ser/Thr protein kinase RdoA (MazF antagonist)